MEGNFRGSCADPRSAVAGGVIFDYLMSRVRAADAEGELREQFLLISRVELAVMLFLMLAWVPFFVTLYR